MTTVTSSSGARTAARNLIAGAPSVPELESGVAEDPATGAAIGALYAAIPDDVERALRETRPAWGRRDGAVTRLKPADRGTRVRIVRRGPRAGAVIERPLIGITGARARASRVTGLPELQQSGIIDLHHAPYASAVAAAGATPVQIPREVQAHALLSRLDGLVLSGGDDVDPRRYGGRPGSWTTHLDPERDDLELDLIAAAVELGLPLLAICRGCQLLNVARGGTLVGHLSVDDGEAHGQLAYPLDTRVHGLEIVAGELLDGVLAPDVRVNSFHHQAADALGDGVTVAAYAPDGVVEAIACGRLALGVQWHPEYLREQPDPIFAWLVNEARRAQPLARKEHLGVIAT